VRHNLKVSLTEKQIKALIESGSLPADALDAIKQKPSRKKPLHESKLLANGIAQGDDGSVAHQIAFVVGFRTESEGNARGWKKKSLRTSEARKSICHFMGRHAEDFAKFAKHWHNGGSLILKFTRLGYPKVDAMANLGVTMKAAEDAVAMWFGADDGDSLRWRATAFQDSAPKEVGVKIEIETA